jgi:D-alanine-D-alanine ligase
MRIGLVYDLRGDYLAQGYGPEQVAEFDSDATIEALDSAIRSMGHRTERVGNAFALCKRLAAGDRWDMVFNVAEGLRGRCREAQVPAILELYDIPYTFSDPLVCAATLDKAVAKRLVQAAGLPTARFFVVEAERDLAAAETATDYPVFVKPIAEGTGKGIDARSRIDSPAQLREAAARLLREFAQPVLVEEYLPGREFTTGVLGEGETARVLGTLEVRMRPRAGTDIYSYEMKERCEDLVEYLPTERGDPRREVEDLALRCYRVLQCRDAGRVDVRLDRAGRPAFLEVNPLPGLHPTHSDLPMIATREGVSYAELIGTIIECAAKRMEPRHAP